MAVFTRLVFFSLAAVVSPIPHHFLDSLRKGYKTEWESSGGGPEEPIQGVVKVVQLDPRALPQPGFFRRGLNSRRAPSRVPFPAFLSQGRPSPAMAPKVPMHPLNHLNPKVSSSVELRKKQGMQMWQKAIEKGDKTRVALPSGLRDSKQTCAAVPFTQKVTAEGCETVTVYNKLCFGQCNSLFIPSEVDPSSPGTYPHHRRTPCSRCAPSKAHTVTVPLRCGAYGVQEKRVMVVEECKCETGKEEKAAVASLHL